MRETILGNNIRKVPMIERVLADTFSKISNGIKTIRLEVEDVAQAAVLIANLFKRLCMREITGPIVGVVLVLLAVFISRSFTNDRQ